MTTVWYGKSSTKQLQQLLQNKPNFIQLINFPDFIQQLKSFNTKLLQYITNTPQLISQAIQLITKPPLYNDSNQRKFKYPLQTIQIIETQTTCILNSFFKQEINNNKFIYFDRLFDILEQHQILPLLAGYFFRTNICLLNNRYKETLDRVYLRSEIFSKLLNHCHLMPVVNTIQLYLNLDMNKSSESDNGRLEIKKTLINKIIIKIQQQRKYKTIDSAIIIQNLINVLIETIEKYYLILDGKALVQILTTRQCIQTMMNLIKDNWEGSSPAFSFFVSLINYYSFSSFNADQTDPQKKLKNMQRLQSQPMIVTLKSHFSHFLDQILKKNTITLYQYKLLQILCHCISLSSQEILKTMKQTKFFSVLVTILFKHENNNILHMLIQKSFLHVFISERKIYQEYKKHLFCQLDIIQITASRALRTFSEDKIFEQFRKKSFFGHFMRILKIYSGIQTTQEKIINAIKSKTQAWNKISNLLIKPYQSICFKELGSYDGLSQGKYQQFEVKKSNDPLGVPMTRLKPLSNSMIQQIRKQDQCQPPLKEISKDIPLVGKFQVIAKKQKQEELLKSPTHNLPLQISNQNKFIPENHRQIKKVESFKQFMTKKKVEAENQIKLKRSLSNEKKLSGSKGKISNASPKKNNWVQKSDKTSTSINDSKSIEAKEFQTNQIPKTSQMPKIPHYSQKNSNILPNNSSQNLIKPTNYVSNHMPNPNLINKDNQHINSLNNQRNNYISPNQNRSQQNIKNINLSQSNIQKIDTNTLISSQSQKNLQLIKKIKVIQIQAPKQKKYRRIQQKDKILLDFLGITTAGSLIK